MKVCASCGYENDLTRIFCQNCGERLEVSDAISDTTPAPATPYRYGDKAQRKARKKPGFGRLTVTLVREVIGLAILAALLAALLQATRAPDAIPPPQTAKAALTSLLAADIQAARENPYPRSVDVTWEQANTFLASRLTALEGTSNVLRARFERAYIRGEGGEVVLGVEQRLGHWPVYLQLTFQIQSSSQGTTAQPIAGQMGRLPVPKFLLHYFVRTFQDVMDALKAPTSWISTATGVTLTPEGAKLLWPGNGSGNGSGDGKVEP